MRRILFHSVFALVLLSLFGCQNRERSRGPGPTMPMTGDGGTMMEIDGGPVDPIDCGELTLCGESCVSLDSDPVNCGECGVVCGEGFVCDAGECIESDIPPTCPEPRIMCGDACVDLSTNPSHCGFCDNYCESGLCSGGECVSSCTPSCSGRVCGDDGCGGSCGTCSTGMACVEGYCEPVCAAGTTDCSGACVNTLTDTLNCGGCGIRCATGQVCSSGVCTSTTTTGGGETCASATEIPAAGGSRTFSFSGRVANHTPFTCGATSSRPDVTFRYTPTRSGSVTVRTSDPASTDTVLSVFSSSSCTSTYSIACNDDEPGGTLSSEVTFSATAYATYYIVVAPYSATTPTATITVTVTAPGAVP